MGDPSDISNNYLNKKSSEHLLKLKNLEIRNIKYDFTDSSCIQMILCDLGSGRLSPVSVPVVIAEFQADS